jgi:hypothetical protein
MIARCAAAVVLTCLFMAGCQKSASSAPPAAMPKTNAIAPAIPGWPPTNAQPKLQTIKLYVGPEVVTAELAMTQVQVATGMMFRKQMAESEGMLFVFARPHRTSFYMKNTVLPLNVAYLDSDGTILELHELEPLNETPVEAASDKVQYVLEMNKGWFKRHNIGVGSVITCEAGRLRDAFRFGR